MRAYRALPGRAEGSRGVAASRMNNSAISPRCDGECATKPPRYGYAHEDLMRCDYASVALRVHGDVAT